MIEIAALLCFIAGSLILFSRIRSLEKKLKGKGKPKPCYRCAEVASDEFSGLHYCRICRDVVMMTQGAVRHDPPFGYPGSPGYLDFPKKEAS